MKRLLPLLFFATLPLLAQDSGRWATVNGHRLYYETMGHGRPLVLLHGGGNTIHGSFAKQIDEFAKTHAVIAPEQIGHGHTPFAGEELTYAGMAEDTAELLRQLGVREADLVGWSDGGNVALILAARHPELVRRVVVSGANFSPLGLPEADRNEMRAKEAAGQWPTPFDGKLNHMWLTSPEKSELSLEILHSIQKPVLVMSGDHDAILLDHTLALFRALPQGQLCILPKTGHGTFNERPEWVNAIVLAFLGA